MAYPPTLPPSTRTDSSVSAGNHASDHNKLAAAIADVLAELGANPSGGYGDLTTRLAELDALVAGGGPATPDEPAGAGILIYDAGTDTYAPAEGRILTGPVDPADSVDYVPQPADLWLPTNRQLGKGARYAAGLWYGADGLRALVNHQARHTWTRLYLEQPVRADALGHQLNNAGAGAGAVIRTALYRDTGDGIPGAIVAGTEATTAPLVGDLVGAFPSGPVDLEAGVYWAGMHPQGFTTLPSGWFLTSYDASTTGTIGTSGATAGYWFGAATPLGTGMRNPADISRGATNLAQAPDVKLRVA